MTTEQASYATLWAEHLSWEDISYIVDLFGRGKRLAAIQAIRRAFLKDCGYKVACHVLSLLTDFS